MSYTDIYLQPKSKPPYFLVFAAIAVMVGGVFTYYFTNTGAPTRASKKTVKRNDLVNASSHEVSVFWQSEDADNGWVMFGTNELQLNQVAIDERDTSDKKSVHIYHYARLKNLTPETTYYYKIVSNNELIGSANNSAFSFKTPRDITTTSSINPAYGKVIMPNGDPASQVFVIVSVPNAYPIVTLTKTTGEWLIPMQSAVNKDTNEPITITEKVKATVEILSDDMATSIIALVKKMSPIPQTVILGKDYQFTSDDDVLPASSKRIVLTQDYPVTVDFPKQDAVIPGTHPLIKGTGVPGKEVVVNINSRQPFSSKVTVDKNGDWKVTVDNSIPPGRYDLTFISDNARGKKVGIKRSFTIAKSGEAVVLGESISTPSATLAPTKAPTLIPTVTPTVGALTPTFTPMPTYPPTAIPTQGPATPTPPPPTTGMNVAPYFVTGVGFVIVGTGLVLLF